MIIVLDTNVIVSALLSSTSSPGEIFRRWESDEFDVTISTVMLEELERVLKYPRIAEHLKMSQEEIGIFLRYLSIYATVVEPETSLDVVVQDPSDNRVLECALSGNASYIVTGDHHLLEIEEYQGIVILPPAGFIALLDLGKKKPK